MRMFATTALLIAGILINQAFAQTAQNATSNAQKSPKTELKTSNNATNPVSQKAAETKAVSSQTQASKPASQAMPAENKVENSKVTAMNKEVTTKHHRGRKAYQNETSAVNKNKSESARVTKPVEPKTH